jgi:type III secretion protein T
MIAETQPLGMDDLVKLSLPIIVGSARIGAAFLVMPLLSTKVIPKRIRAGITFALVLAAYPMFAPIAASMEFWSKGQWVGFALKEAFIGAVVGYSMGVIIWALTALGELIDTQVGYNNTKIFDPFTNHEQGPIAVFMSQLGGLLFLGLGGLHVFLQILYESFNLWPPGSFYPELSVALSNFAVATAGSLLELAVRIAAPIVGVLLVVELGIGLINRMAPQLNTFYFAMPVKGVTALLMLALLLTHIVDVVVISIGSPELRLQTLDSVWRKTP